MTTIQQLRKNRYFYCPHCQQTTPHEETRDHKRRRFFRCKKCRKETFTLKTTVGRPNKTLEERVALLSSPIRYIVRCDSCNITWLSKYSAPPVTCWKCKSNKIRVVGEKLIGEEEKQQP